MQGIKQHPPGQLAHGMQGAPAWLRHKLYSHWPLLLAAGSGLCLGLGDAAPQAWPLVSLALLSWCTATVAAERTGHGARVLCAAGATWALAGMGWVVLAVRTGDDWHMPWQLLVLTGVLLHRMLSLCVPWWLAGVLARRLPRAEGWAAWRWAVAVAASECLLQLGWFGHGYAGLAVGLIDAPGAPAALAQFGGLGLCAWLALAIAAAVRVLLGTQRLAGLQPARSAAVLCMAGALLAPSAWVATAARPGVADAPVPVLALTNRGERHGEWTQQTRDAAVLALMQAMRAAPVGSVVLTPETYLGAAPPPSMEGLWADLVTLADERSLQVLAGMPNLFRDERGTHAMNSVTQIAAGQMSVYGKERMVPFAEYLPWPGLLRFVYRHVFETALDHQQPAPPALQQPLYVQGHPVGVLICHELSFASTTAARARDADWLFSTSYDGWIGSRAYLAQMLGLTRLRAMETGKPVLRVAAGGDSYLVDAQGRVQVRASADQGPWFITAISPQPGVSAYLALGWLLPWLALACLLLPAVAAQLRRRLARPPRSLSRHPA